jgi:RNA polymerase sigma factor (sigma-70 family)
MDHPGVGISGVQQLFEAELGTLEHVLGYVQRRHHLPSSEAADFGSFVKLKLIENDYAVLRQFTGRSSLRTYLCVVVQRLLIDYRTHAWGKWRPSAEARRAGPIAILLDRLLTRDGHTFEEACEILITNHRVSMNRNELERLAARLPARASRRFEPEDTLESMSNGSPSAEHQVMGADRGKLAGRLGRQLHDSVGRLPVRDRLVLKLRFEDGCTAKDIAAVLGVTERGVYTQIDRLLRELRRTMEKQGFSTSEVKDVLEDPAAFIGGSGTLEVSDAGPSMREEG